MGREWFVWCRCVVMLAGVPVRSFTVAVLEVFGGRGELGEAEEGVGGQGDEGVFFWPVVVHGLFEGFCAAHGEDFLLGLVEDGKDLVVAGAFGGEALEEGGEDVFTGGAEGEVGEGCAVGLGDGGAVAGEVGGAGEIGGSDFFLCEFGGVLEELVPLFVGEVWEEVFFGPVEGAAGGGDGADGEPFLG